MKVVYEDGERDRIKAGYDAVRECGMGGALFGEHDPDKIYGITFKVTKPEIAECILFGLLRDKLTDFDIGIDVQSIEFDILPKRSELVNKLHEAIDNIMG